MQDFQEAVLIPNESKELVKKLKKISDSGDFLVGVTRSLKTEEERHFVINAIDNGELTNSSEIIFLAVQIDAEREKAKGKGNYLKKVKITKFELSDNSEDDIDYEELFKKADDGDVRAMLNVVYGIKIEDMMDETSKNWFLRRRIIYLKQLSEIKGHETALILVGDAYAYGEGVPQDAQEAIRWYKKAIKAGATFVYENIGLLYFEGLGVTVDYKKAFNYFTRDYFSKNKYGKSMSTLYSLGEMYRQGLYVEQDIDQACEYYMRIVYNPSDSYRYSPYYCCACYRFGMIMYEDWKTEKALNTALKLLTEAKTVYDKSNEKRKIGNLTKEEIEQSWQIVNQAVASYKKHEQ